MIHIYQYHLVGRKGWLIDINIYSAHQRAMRIAKSLKQQFFYIEKLL